MKISWLPELVLLLTVLSGPVIAGQPNDSETEGTREEPECDYIAVTNSL